MCNVCTLIIKVGNNPKKCANILHKVVLTVTPVGGQVPEEVHGVVLVVAPGQVPEDIITLCMELFLWWPLGRSLRILLPCAWSCSCGGLWEGP
jgi:hypothetical protein